MVVKTLTEAFVPEKDFETMADAFGDLKTDKYESGREITKFCRWTGQYCCVAYSSQVPKPDFYQDCRECQIPLLCQLTNLMVARGP